MFARRWLLAVALVALSGTAAQAVDLPSPALPRRTKFLIVNKGTPVAGTGTIRNIDQYDRLVIILVGTGRATLEVSDFGNPGDTINVYTELVSVFPMVFTGQATSPDTVIQQLMTTTLGFVTVDIGYLNAINPTPLDYGYTLKF